MEGGGSVTVLEGKLRKVARRLRFLDGLSAAVSCLFYGLVAATAVVVVHKLVDLGYLYGLFVAVAVLVTIPYGLAAAMLARRDLFDAAMAADERLGLKDRAASSVAVTDEGRAMADLLHEDAERAAGLIDPVRHFPFRAPRQARWIPLPLAAMLVLAALCPEFDLFGLREKKQQKKVVDEAIKAQVKEIKDRAAKVRRRKKVRVSKKEEKLLREIENAAEDLRGSKNKRAAMMKLSKAAEALKEERKKYENLGKVAAKMKALSQGAGDKGVDAMKKFAKKMGEGDFKGASEELRRLKRKLEEMAKEGKLTKEQQDALRRELEKMADAAKEMESVSRSLESLSEGLPELSELGEYAELDIEDAMEELEGLEKMTPEEIRKLAELARQGQMEMMQRKLQLAKAGQKCDQCGKAKCPVCGRPRCGCSGEEQCECPEGG